MRTIIKTTYKYTTLELIEDLREELQKHPEKLTKIFPKRVFRFTDFDLSRLWRGPNKRYISKVKKRMENENPNFRFKDSKNSLQLLEQILIKKLAKKASGSLKVITKYRNNELNTLEMVDKIKIELGKVLGNIKVLDIELSIILAGTETFIKTIKDIILRQTHLSYNPDYKFSRERLDNFKKNLQIALCEDAKKSVVHS